MLATAFGPVAPETAALDLVEEIERLLIDPLTLFFDDAEHVAEHERAARIIGALIGSDVPAAAGRRRVAPAAVAAPGEAARRGAGDGPGRRRPGVHPVECEELLRAGAPVD